MLWNHGKTGAPDSFTTTNEYWDCECSNNYIKRSTIGAISICTACNTREDDGRPDSRLNEVQEAGLPVLEMEFE